MKLRVAFLARKEPNEWAIDGRTGTTFYASVLLDNGDPVTLKVSKEFDDAVLRSGLKLGNVLDIVFEPRVLLQNNANGRPEQVLKITPARFEYIAASVHLPTPPAVGTQAVGKSA